MPDDQHPLRVGGVPSKDEEPLQELLDRPSVPPDLGELTVHSRLFRARMPLLFAPWAAGIAIAWNTPTYVPWVLFGMGFYAPIQLWALLGMRR